MISTHSDRREWRVTATSENSAPPRALGRPCSAWVSKTGAFTLLEIIIALTLVAILVSASLPYLFDSFTASAGDRAAEAITAKAQEIRKEAMESAESRKLILTGSGIKGMNLPSGWRLEVKGMNDSKFHPPLRNQSWGFNSAGICEPLALRLLYKDREILLSFDALTAQPVHEDE